MAKDTAKSQMASRNHGIARIRLDPEIMNCVDTKSGYVFSKHLATRSEELQLDMELGGVVLSPLIVREEETQLVDGYCRYTTLKTMSIPRIYVYSGIL